MMPPATRELDASLNQWRATNEVSSGSAWHHGSGIRAAGCSADVKANAWELVGVGILPVANQFGIYAKLGAHRSEAKLESNAGASAKDTGNGLTFGGGAQWNVMPALGLRAEWQRYSHLG